MSKENVKTPKVFISYSWTNKDFVIKLADRLMTNGIETIIDVWYLKQGNDKYSFMESMVKDKTIDHVLIICDKAYKEKADNRTGGVGDETVIISPQLYGEMDQTKFIPIVLEKDEDGTPYKPIYIESRIHFDFSNKDSYENEFESLIRFLFDEPYYRKPKLGKKPEWLNKDAISISPINNLVDIMRSSANEARKNNAISEFTQVFINKTKEFKVITNPNIDVEKYCIETENQINSMKPLRDSYLDFLKELIMSEKKVPDFFCSFIEKLYNELLLLKINGNSYNEYDKAMLSIYAIFIWNIFISTISYLRYYEKYSDIFDILTTTFYLIEGITPLQYKKAETFLEFRCFNGIIDNYYRNDLLSKTADLVVKQIKEPIITTEFFAQTDILLSQLSFALKTSRIKDHGWFALSYVYSKNFDNIWIKLSSKKYCQKILPLFGVKSIEELIKIIKDNPVPERYGYSNSFYSIPRIPLKIQDYEIASLN